MRAPLIRTLLLALVAALAAAQDPAAGPRAAAGEDGRQAPRVLYPASVEPGQAISGRVSAAEPLADLEVALLEAGAEGPRSVLVQARGFRLEGQGADAPEASAASERWAFLLGLPSTLEPGPYLLRVRAAAAGGEPGVFLHLGQVSVREREFRSEAIWFDASLTELMTTSDPRREREAAELREVLSSFDPGAVRHTGTLLNPVAGARRTSLFADRRLYRYVDGGSSRSLHNGVDLAAPEGTPVLAAGSGCVVFSGPRVMSGCSVILEHLPGVYSLYYHLKDSEVRPGDLVVKGARIGTVGQTGLATGPHLHWELRVSGVAVDPEAFLSRALIDKSPDSGTLMEFRPWVGP